MSWTGHAMNSERGINNPAGNLIELRRGFNHLGVLALTWKRASAR